MALFASMAACGQRCRDQMKNKVWAVAFEARSFTGQIVARFIRFMAPTSPTTRAYGKWEETNDDSIS